MSLIITFVFERKLHQSYILQIALATVFYYRPDDVDSTKTKKNSLSLSDPSLTNSNNTQTTFNF